MLVYRNNFENLNSRFFTGNNHAYHIYPYIANVCMNVSLCVGRSKAFAGQYILYCPASRAI